MRNQSWMKVVCGLAIVLGVAGLAGCGSDDDEKAGTTTTVAVVTNHVNGTVATNVVAVPSADPAVDEADVQDDAAPAAAILNVAGTWNGPVTANSGHAANHLKLQLTQTGNTVNGQYLMNRLSGNANGSIQGDHLVVNLMFGISPWILDGHVNAGATSYTGNWNMNPDTGTFALQK